MPSPVVDAVLTAVVPAGYLYPRHEVLSAIAIRILRSPDEEGGNDARLPSSQAWESMSDVARRLRFVQFMETCYRLQKLDPAVDALRGLQISSWCAPKAAEEPPPQLARRAARSNDDLRRLELTVRVVNGQLVQFDGSPMPVLADCVAELRVPEVAVVDAGARTALGEVHQIPLLAAGSVVRCRVGLPDGVRPSPGQFEYHFIWQQHGHGAFIEVVLDEPLLLRTRGGKRASLCSVTCRIPALQDKECSSLNEAYRVISETYETWRRSHAGNVFYEFQALDEQSGRWKPLDDLRTQHEETPVVPVRRPTLATSELRFPLPAIVAAADWSVNEPGRRIAVATLDPSRPVYVVSAARSVGAPDVLLDSLMASAHRGGALLGLDFPIGLPETYFRQLEQPGFKTALGEFGSGRFDEFFDPSDEPTLHRPFFPASNFGTHKTLVAALGVSQFDELRRQCERRSSTRKAASSVFFTLGAGQVGRAACHGWKEVLQPRLSAIDLWPYDGELNDLLERRGLTVAEVYPSEAYRRLGISLGTATTGRRIDRTARTHACAHWLDDFRSGPIVLDSDARRQVASGFDSADDFDAMAALLGMLLIVTGSRRQTFPDTAVVKQVEGWILGQDWA